MATKPTDPALLASLLLALQGRQKKIASGDNPAPDLKSQQFAELLKQENTKPK